MTANKPRTVLLVDDHADSLDVFRAVLEHSGYRVLVAEDGEECLRLARAELPDLILMDLWMPGVDGWQATAQLKADASTAHIVVLAVSANVLLDAQERALSAGCAEFLSKPVEPSRILATVRQHIG
jgi:two-component system, cell cycle response regulator DivK